MESMGIWASFKNMYYFEHQMLITLNMNIIWQPKSSVVYFIQEYVEMFFFINISFIWEPMELMTSKKSKIYAK